MTLPLFTITGRVPSLAPAGALGRISPSGPIAGLPSESTLPRTLDHFVDHLFAQAALLLHLGLQRFEPLDKPRNLMLSPPEPKINLLGSKHTQLLLQCSRPLALARARARARSKCPGIRAPNL